MAVTIARLGSTPHRLRYLVTQDGAAGTATSLTQAQMTQAGAFNAASGPLREALTNPGLAGATAWADILSGSAAFQPIDQSSRIEASIVQRSGAAAASLVILFTTGPNVMNVTAPSGAATWILEFRYRRSPNN